MSEASGGTKCWECIHCHKQLQFPGAIPESLSFCLFCGKSQTEHEVNCVNPECGTKLLISTAKFCHKCNRPQQQKLHEDPPVELQQHKGAVKEAGEALPQKSEGEMTHQAEGPQTSTHETKSKQDTADKNSLASSKTQLLPENGQPNSQEIIASNSQAKKLESTNATSASLSSEISSSERTSVSQDEVKDNQTPLQVSDSTTKTGDTQQESNHPSSQPQGPLEESQPVEKTQIQGTKSAGDTLAPQEHTDNNSQAKTTESTNVTSASLSSEMSSAERTLAPDQDKLIHNGQTPLPSDDSTSKTGDDVQKENSHPSSPQKSQLGEGQGVEKTQAQDTKSTGDTQTSQPDSDKNAVGIKTRSQSTATGSNMSTSSNSSATPLQNANLRQGSTHESKHNTRKRGSKLEEEATPDPKQPKIFGQNPATGVTTSSGSPNTTSRITTPIQETTPGGDSSAGQVGTVNMYSGFCEMMEFTTFREV